MAGDGKVRSWIAVMNWRDSGYEFDDMQDSRQEEWDGGQDGEMAGRSKIGVGAQKLDSGKQALSESDCCAQLFCFSTAENLAIRFRRRELVR
jgi:hypothetical protein